MVNDESVNAGSPVPVDNTNVPPASEQNKPSGGDCEGTATPPPTAGDASAAEGAAAPVANSPEQQTGTPSSEPNSRAIKIGSQRDEEERFAPKPVAVAAPSIVPPGGEVSSAEDITELARLKREAAEEAENESANPTAPVVESDVPPPSLDRVISPDLEAEIAEALGDVAIDDLLAEPNTPAASADDELDTESRRRATVVKVDREFVFFALGGSHEGAASLRQFTKPPVVGEAMDITISGRNREDGLYEVHIPGATISAGNWEDLEEGLVVEARITGHNAGGLECQVSGLRGFIPASQIALFHVDDFSEFVDQKLTCVVVEVNPPRKLVLSRRGVLERERESAREKMLQELEVGQSRDGVVRKVMDFGAFVDIGGIDGLVHVSKLSWDRVEKPSDVVSEGDKVKVKIEKIDPVTGKIGLSLRDTTKHPWADVATRYSSGTIVTGTVTRTADFGAFVRLEAGIEGLIHISELAHHRVQRATSVVQQGQEVEVKILSIDTDAQRMSLSLKALQLAPVKPSNKKGEAEDEPLRESDIPEFSGTLKGGTNRPTGGEGIGLNW